MKEVGSPFYLVESRQGPRAEFKDELKEGETFHTDFIGASTEDCGSWALQQQAQNGAIETDIIALIDERSIKD